MRMKSALLVGFPMMIPLTGCVVHTPDIFTETVRRVDVIERIGHGGLYICILHRRRGSRLQSYHRKDTELGSHRAH